MNIRTYGIVIFALASLVAVFILVAGIDKQLRQDEIYDKVQPIEEPRFIRMYQRDAITVDVVIFVDATFTRYTYTCELQPDMIMKCEGTLHLGGSIDMPISVEWDYEKW